MKKYIGIIILFFAAGSLKAQTENNSERLITQLKNGTAPRLKFAKNIPVATAPAVVRAAATEKTQPLASEQPIRKEEIKIATAPPVIPNQEEKKKE